MGSEEFPPQGSGPSGEDTGSPGDEQSRQPGQPSPGGSMRFQDPAKARPRPPTVGETRAREKAERKRREIEKARVEAELKRHQRNQRLKGGAAAVWQLQRSLHLQRPSVPLLLRQQRNRRGKAGGGHHDQAKGHHRQDLVG